MVEALDKDFIVVAEAKGVTRPRLVWHHAFRNALVVTVTVIGMEFGAVLAGSLVIETVYRWPGLGLGGVARSRARGCQRVQEAGREIHVEHARWYVARPASLP